MALLTKIMEYNEDQLDEEFLKLGESSTLLNIKRIGLMHVWDQNSKLKSSASKVLNRYLPYRYFERLFRVLETKKTEDTEEELASAELQILKEMLDNRMVEIQTLKDEIEILKKETLSERRIRQLVRASFEEEFEKFVKSKYDRTNAELMQENVFLKQQLSI